MGLSVTTYAMSKKYADEAVNGMGAIKGAPCTIKETAKTDNGTLITFEWTSSDGNVQTTQIEVLDGKQGNPGPQGSQGPKGDTGSKGDKGDKGDPGPKGDSGEPGMQGEKGDQGIQGLQGPQGPQGIQGIKGDTGAQGIQGPQGPRGEKGDPFTISKIYSSIDDMNANFATDGVLEGQFVIINSNVEEEDNGKLYIKTSENYQFVTDLSGAAGIQGPQGEQGIQGPQGEKGDQGEQGVQGPQGIQGEKGETGPQGEKGDSGEPGPKGDPGEKGDQGDPGPKGDKGDQGEKGNDGVSISKVEQTTTGTNNGDTNIITVTMSDGNSYTFSVKNGEQGIQGPQGEKGDPFKIVKTYPTIADMDADFDSDAVKEGQFVMISSNIEEEDNAKLYVKGTSMFTFVTDLSGAQGIQGSDGVSVVSIQQTKTSPEDGGENEITITLSNGQTSILKVRNGNKGSDATVTVDTSLDPNSNNPIANKTVANTLSTVNAELNNKAPKESPVFTGSISLGRKENTTVGDKSFAVGLNVEATATVSHAEGEATMARTIGSHAEGKSTEAGQSGGQSYAHAEGVSSRAYGRGSHAEGESTFAQGQFSHAEGGGCQATANYSHSEGCNSGNTKTTASNEGAHAEGRGTTSSGSGSHSEGELTVASGNYSHAEGYESQATQPGAHAEGTRTQATAEAAHSEGQSTLAKATGSHAEGVSSFTETSAVGAHAEGNNTRAYGLASHTEGVKTSARGDYSHAEGDWGTAYGYASHAEGKSSYKADEQLTLSDSTSFSEIQSAWSNKNFSLSYGKHSHTEGRNGISFGVASHAEGDKTKAIGEGSHAEGLNTFANAAYQHVQGKYNLADDTKAHIVGWGESDDARENIHTLDTAGNAYFKGDISFYQTPPREYWQNISEIYYMSPFGVNNWEILNPPQVFGDDVYWCHYQSQISVYEPYDLEFGVYYKCRYSINSSLKFVLYLEPPVSGTSMCHIYTDTSSNYITGPSSLSPNAKWVKEEGEVKVTSLYQLLQDLQARITELEAKQ